MTVHVTHNLESLRRSIMELRREQIPYATAVALTKTAQDAQAAVRQEMVRVFDRPTPFTVAGVRIKPATKTNLTAEVFIREDNSKAVPLAKALAHQATGGPRWWKRSEGALRKIGLLGVNENAVPGEAADIDEFGNMSKGQIVQILAWFEAFSQQGYKANMTKEGRKNMAKGKAGVRYGVRYFYKRDRPGRGIYLATQTAFGSAIKPVLMFVRRGLYTRRLDMEKTVRETVKVNFNPRFIDALEQAKRTQR